MNESDPFFDNPSRINRRNAQRSDARGVDAQDFDSHAFADRRFDDGRFDLQPYGEPRPHEQQTAISAWRRLLHETVQVVLPALALALVVHLFLAQATIVYGQSMEPNLVERQRLIIDKISFKMHPPQRDDIVVLSMPSMEEMLVKRVIGLPGETIEIHQGVVYVNNEPLPEPFPHDIGGYSMPPLTLGPLSYFVLGDNRDNSNDSRSFGPVKREYILGRVWLRYWPFNQATQF